MLKDCPIWVFLLPWYPRRYSGSPSRTGQFRSLTITNLTSSDIATSSSCNHSLDASQTTDLGLSTCCRHNQHSREAHSGMPPKLWYSDHVFIGLEDCSNCGLDASRHRLVSTAHGAHIPCTYLDITFLLPLHLCFAVLTRRKIAGARRIAAKP